MNSNAKFEDIIEQIASRSYAIFDNYLTKSELKALRKSLLARYLDDQFKDAGISKDKEIIKKVRGDEIFWIENSLADKSEKEFLVGIENLMTYFNTTCFTQLKSYEIHYAVYPVNSFYKRHLDVFKIGSDRKFTIIVYLNKKWINEDGGQLRIFLKNETIDILPLGGRLVIFESDKIEHEVLPTFKKRKSITGWLKESNLNSIIEVYN